MRIARAAAPFLVTLCASACNDPPVASDGAPSARPSRVPTGSASVATPPGSADTKGAVVAIPYPAEKVTSAVNPRGEAPYAGPVGTLKGTVRIKGEPAPEVTLSLPKGCPGEATATHGKLFRVGQDGTLADVLVAATGYKGFVPAREEAKKVTIHGCALSRRTLALAYGQRLEVANLDKLQSYMPYLDGGQAKAILVAMPGGDPVRLYPQEPGHYMLRDELPKPFLTADVYALKYATHDVTGLDGQFEIKGIPVGKIKVSAFLPSIDETAEKEAEIVEGVTTVDFVLQYKKGKGAAKVPAPKK